MPFLCKYELISIGSDFNIWVWLGAVLSTFNDGTWMHIILTAHQSTTGPGYTVRQGAMPAASSSSFVNLYYIYSLLEQCHTLEAIKPTAR